MTGIANTGRPLQLQGLLGHAALLPQGQPAAPAAPTAHPATKAIAIVPHIGLQVVNTTGFAFLEIATDILPLGKIESDTFYLATCTVPQA
jgi:hypothetical protein